MRVKTPRHRETAIEKMHDGKDMVNSVVELDLLYQAIFKAGIKEVVKWIESHEKSLCMDCLCTFDFRDEEWQSKLREWGIK